MHKLVSDTMVAARNSQTKRRIDPLQWDRSLKYPAILASMSVLFRYRSQCAICLHLVASERENYIFKRNVSQMSQTVIEINIRIAKNPEQHPGGVGLVGILKCAFKCQPLTNYCLNNLLIIWKV